MVSVQDEHIPDTSSTVRGQLIVSGWKVSSLNNQIDITYVNQVDLAGYIPSAFLKKLLLQIPLCAGKVRDYITKYGFVPTTVIEKVEFKGEEFDHDARRYTLELNGDGGGSVETLCSERMFPQGIQVELKGQAELSQSVDKHNNPCIHLNKIQGHVQLFIKNK